MDNLINILNIDEEILQPIVFAILHSFWQFTIIALLMSLAFRKYKNSKPNVRYNIAFGSLIVALTTFIFTFLYLVKDNDGSLVESLNMTQRIMLTEAHLFDKGIYASIQEWIFANSYIIFLTWSIGVIVYMIKFVFSLSFVEFLSKTSRPVNHYPTNQAYLKVSQYFSISKHINISESKYISSPMILGLLQPIILFPIGIINQLNSDQVEAILAHELAHYVRKDIYLNIIQSLIEVLFYYHPAIWWISTNIKIERENCCDDLAISFLGDNISYAKTLVKMQEMQQLILTPSLALNFSKKNNFFSNRIKRILNMAHTRNYLKEKIITSVALIFIVMIFSKNLTGSNFNNNLDNRQSNQKQEKELFIIKNDTVPRQKESIRIQKKTNDKEIKISMEDGEITDLEVNGKKIESKDFDKYQDIISEVKPAKKNMSKPRIFFFGDENDGDSFDFSFGSGIDIDSIFKKIPDFNNIKGLDNFEFQNKDWSKNMQNLKEQLGRIKFNFEGIDTSFQFDFAFPDDTNMWQENPQFKIFEFKDGDTYVEPFGEYPNDYFELKSPDKNNFSESLGNALNRDGFLIPGEENKVELTGKHLKINGEKQPTNIWQKYKRIFEGESGTTLQKNSKLEFKFQGKEAKRKYRVY